MDFSPQDFLTPDEIISEAAAFAGERDFKTVTEGFCMGQIRRCLNELGYIAFLNEKDILLDIPENLQLQLPKGCFNIKQMYAYSGNECVIGQNTVNVYWKRNYLTAGGTGYAARNKYNNQKDPFYNPETIGYGANRAAKSNLPSGGSRPTDLYYFGISDGVIYLSSNITKFNKLLIRANATSGALGDTPFIPEYLQDVVVDWVTEAILRVKIASSKPEELSRWKMLFNDVTVRLGFKPNNMVGSWYNAKVRITSMNSKTKEDLKEYLSKLNY